MERFKVETGRMEGAPECMRISGFMHVVNNPELTKHLNEHVPKTMKEMMITTTAFIRGEAVVAGKKKGHTSWRTQDQSKRHGSERRFDFRGQPRDGRSKFTPLTRTPKEILTTEAGKFKPPPPMVTPVEKRSSNKFCDFHNDKRHSTDECMELKKHIEELVRAGKLSHLIKEIKKGRYQPKVGKKEVQAKDKSMAIYMIQPWHRMTRQKVTQSFKCVSEITFPSLTTSSGIEGTLVIEAKIGGHMIYRMYVDGGGSNRRDANRERTTETMFTPEEKLRHIRMATSDMTGVPRSNREQRINIWKGIQPCSTKKWVQAWGAKAITSGEAEQAFKKLKLQPPVRATPDGSTQAKGGTDCIPVRHPRSYYQAVAEDRSLRIPLEKARTKVVGPSMVEYQPAEPWTLHGRIIMCSGLELALILTSPEGIGEFTYAARFQFTLYTRGREYEALIAGLRIAAQMGVRNVHVSVDSKLVANQVLGEYVAKEENMIKYLEKVKSLTVHFLKPWIAGVWTFFTRNNVIREIHEGHAVCSQDQVRGSNKPYRTGILLATDGGRTSKVIDKENGGLFENDMEVVNPSRQLNRGECSIYEAPTVQWTPVRIEQTELGEKVSLALGEERRNWIRRTPPCPWAYLHWDLMSCHGDTPVP
ncbi:reverse transcriptase domain-containing protein [Tanacetum coccineum]